MLRGALLGALTGNACSSCQAVILRDSQDVLHELLRKAILQAKGGTDMTKLLEEAFSKASQLSSEEQDALAEWLLRELQSESRWEKLFLGSQDELSDLATDALAEHSRGETEELDPDRL